MKKWMPRPLLTAALDVLGVVALSLAFAPWGQFYLAWVAMVPWILSSRRAASAARAAGRGWALGVLFFTLNLSWLWTATIPGMVPCVLFAGLSFAGAFATMRLMRDWPPLAQVLLAPAAWTTFEAGRSFFATGFPYVMIGHSQSPMIWLIQVSDVAGVSGVTYWVVMVNVTLALLLVRSTPATRRTVPYKALVAAAAATAFVLTYGGLRSRVPQSGRMGPRVALLQSNHQHAVGGAQTVTQEQQISDAFSRTTAFVAADGGEPDLFVWTETLMPGLNLEARTEPGLAAAAMLARTHEAVASLARLRGASILTGGYFVGGWRGELGHRRATDIRNSVYLYHRDGRQDPARYDKIHLVPGAERIWFRESWPWAHRMLLSFATRAYASGYQLSPGADDALTVFNIDGSDEQPIRAFTPICFEDTVAPLVRRFVLPQGGDGKRADVLINISNDGWFNTLEKHQHLQAALFRCVENRIAAARANNTGISAIIDSAGRIVQRAQPNEATFLVGRVPLDPRLSLYTRWGEWFAGGCAAATFAALVYLAVSSRAARQGVSLEPA